MFNLQGSELVIILLLALVVLGPEKLPDAMRKAGQFYAELKKMSSGFQSEFKAAVEEPLNELKDTANTLRDSADFTKLQDGERAEKPKSAEMVAAPDPDAVPVDDLPFTPTAAAAGVLAESQLVESDPVGTDAAEAADSAPPTPFSSDQQLSTSPPVEPPADSTPLAPFSSSQQLSTSPPATDDAAVGAQGEAPAGSSHDPGETSGATPPASVPGFSIPAAASWSQHFSESESAEPSDPDTSAPTRPAPGESPGDDPGSGSVDADTGESSE